jgi:methylamine--corrinoid protein Co-methyltransferase
LLGGYSGGPEGTALSNVAHHLMGLLTYQASWMLPFPIHLRYVSSSCRELLWVISTTGQAISRNSDIISINLNYTSAGPCTTMCLFETSASVLAAVTSGLSIESVGVASNRYEDRTTPVEPRISAEVGHAVAGMKLSDANEVANKLLAKYESKLSNPPLGKGLYECWDAEKRKPTKEYRTVIRSYKKSMSGLGVELKDELS